MISIWNNAIWEISSFIQMAGNHRSTVIIDKIYKVFFHCDNYLPWAHRPHQVLHSTFILTLDVEFELALHQYDEDYATDDICDLPKLLKRAAHIYAVTSRNEGSFDTSGCQGGAASIPSSTLTGRTVGCPFYRIAEKCLNFDAMPPPIMKCDDEEEEYFPTAPLDDRVWSEDPILETDVCIHMAPGKSEASYPSDNCLPTGSHQWGLLSDVGMPPTWKIGSHLPPGTTKLGNLRDGHDSTTAPTAKPDLGFSSSMLGEC